MIVRRENEIAALFDERAGQRLGEGALRQGELDRIAQTLVAAFVLGRENHRHLRARPRTFGEIGGRLRLAEATAAGRQSKRHLRRIDEGAAGDRLAVDHGLRKIGLGAGHAIIVVDLVTQRQRAAHVRLRLADERDDRRLVGNRNDVISGEDTAVAAHDEAAVAVQCPAFLAVAGAAGERRRRRGAGFAPSAEAGCPGFGVSSAPSVSTVTLAPAELRTMTFEPTGASTRLVPAAASSLTFSMIGGRPV